MNDRVTSASLSELADLMALQNGPKCTVSRLPIELRKQLDEAFAEGKAATNLSRALWSYHQQKVAADTIRRHYARECSCAR